MYRHLASAWVNDNGAFVETTNGIKDLSNGSSISQQNQGIATVKREMHTPETSKSNDIVQSVLTVPPPNLLKRKLPPTETFISSATLRRSIPFTSSSSSSSSQSDYGDSHYSVEDNNRRSVTHSPRSPRSSSPDSGSDASPSSACSSSWRIHVDVAQGGHGISAHLRWTPAQDARLWKAIGLLRNSGWDFVSHFVGDSVTVSQCQTRWETALAFQEHEVTKAGAWRNEEATRLAALVQQYTVAPYWSECHKVMTRERVSWAAIGRELGREPVACYRKWKGLSYRTVDQQPLMSSGYDSSAQSDYASTREDADDQYEREQPPDESDESDASGDSGTRRAAVPKSTSKALHSATKSQKWSKDEDKSLREGVRLYKESGGWKRVAEFVGGGRTLIQCENRYSNTLRHVDGGLPVVVDWSTAEMEKLTSLVQRHTVAPYWSENTNGMTRAFIDWKTISREMDKKPKDCSNKWEHMTAAKMKKGPFTPGEDALIIHTVREWGDKGNGLWVKLRQELGRSNVVIRQRWKNVLCEKVKA